LFFLKKIEKVFEEGVLGMNGVGNGGDLKEGERRGSPDANSKRC
jgi:hypothetical protein